jgi:hypothetical protein
MYFTISYNMRTWYLIAIVILLIILFFFLQILMLTLIMLILNRPDSWLSQFFHPIPNNRQHADQLMHLVLSYTLMNTVRLFGIPSIWETVGTVLECIPYILENHWIFRHLISFFWSLLLDPNSVSVDHFVRCPKASRPNLLWVYAPLRRL